MFICVYPWFNEPCHERIGANSGAVELISSLALASYDPG